MGAPRKKTVVKHKRGPELVLTSHLVAHEVAQQVGKHLNEIRLRYKSYVAHKIARLPSRHKQFPGRLVRIHDWCAISDTLNGKHLLTLSVTVQRKDGGGDMYSKKATFSVYGKDLIFEKTRTEIEITHESN